MKNRRDDTSKEDQNAKASVSTGSEKAETYLNEAASLIEVSPGKALELCDLAEQLYRSAGQKLQAIRARLLSSQILLAQGQWRSAKRRFAESQALLAGLDDGKNVGSSARLWLLRLKAEILYVGFQKEGENLEELYEALQNIVAQLERMRRILPGSFSTIWLFGRLDVYERLVAVAYQLGLVEEAADWAERTKARRLLDLLLNLPLEQEHQHASE